MIQQKCSRKMKLQLEEEGGMLNVLIQIINLVMIHFKFNLRVPLSIVC